MNLYIYKYEVVIISLHNFDHILVNVKLHKKFIITHRWAVSQSVKSLSALFRIEINAEHMGKSFIIRSCNKSLILHLQYCDIYTKYIVLDITNYFDKYLRICTLWLLRKRWLTYIQTYTIDNFFIIFLELSTRCLSQIKFVFSY